jgi:ABC-2 type transport system ATP-binding protein
MVEVREVIKDLKRQHYTVFMSSHLLGEVEETCDAAALIDHGKLLVYDDIGALERQTKVVKMEVKTANDVTDALLGRVRSMASVRGAERVNGRTFVVTYEGAYDERADLLLSIQKEGAKVSEFSSVGLPLEMLYMDLVKESR